jgi:hypothetical protein
MDCIGFKIKILDALSVVNVRRVRLPPSSLPKIFILKPIAQSAQFADADAIIACSKGLICAHFSKQYKISGIKSLSYNIPPRLACQLLITRGRHANID